MFGLIGEKLGMTQIFDGEGRFVPVTVIRMLPNLVTAIKTLSKHGYNSVQLGYGEKKPKNLKKPQRVFFKKNNLRPVAILKEFRIDGSEKFQVGSEIKVGVFKTGDTVDVQAFSKGKGFQGVMKRFHFGGLPASHGCSVSHRKPGSIGNRAYPGRVFPGKKLPGHMGDEKVKVKNLKVYGVEEEQNLILISGAVPGPRSNVVFIYGQQKDFLNRILSKEDSQNKAEGAVQEKKEKPAEKAQEEVVA